MAGHRDARDARRRRAGAPVVTVSAHSRHPRVTVCRLPSPDGGEDRCDVNLLDLLLPARCVVCGAGGEQLCAGCRESLPLLRPPFCGRCGAPTVWPVSRCRECSGRRLAFVSARAAVEYDERVRRLVGAWKERGLRRLAAAAAELIAEARRAAERRRRDVRPTRSRARAAARPPPGRAARRRARSSLGAPCAPPGRPDALGPATSAACRSPNAGATSPVRSALPRKRLRACSWSTTSTRAAPPPPRPPRRYARAAPAGSRS